MYGRTKHVYLILFSFLFVTICITKLANKLNKKVNIVYFSLLFLFPSYVSCQVYDTTTRTDKAKIRYDYLIVWSST